MQFLRMHSDGAPGARDIILSVENDARPAEAEAPLVLGDPRFIYVPLWDAYDDNIVAYRCTPLWQGSDGDFHAIEALSTVFSNPADRLSIDLDVLEKAIEHLNRVVSQYGILKIVIPVHLSTLLDDRLRESYLAVCAGSVWSVFDNTCFEIIDVGADVPAARLAAALEFIRPYASQVFLCLDSADVSVVPAVPDAADPASILIGRNARRMSLDGDALARELELFGKQAAELPYRTYVHGMRALNETAAAVAAGFAIVGSEAIAPALDEPGAASAADDTKRMLRSLMMDRLRV